MKKTAILITVLLTACSSSGTRTTDTHTGNDIIADASGKDIRTPEDTKKTDTVDTTGVEDVIGDIGDIGDTSQKDIGDTAKDVTQIPDSLKTGPGLTVKALSLPQDKESCGIFQDTRCKNGKTQVCAVWDTEKKAFIQPDGLLKRELLYERWYDLYLNIHGITAGRDFKEGIASGTPETTWADPAKFAGFDGTGDGAIWTGTALVAYDLRYALTGTPADYERMEKKARQTLALFECTGIPGHLARYHFCAVPNDIPTDDPTKYLRHFDPKDPKNVEYVPIPKDTQAYLPAYYTKGFDYKGKHVDCTPYLEDTPSIDQYSAPLVGLGFAWDMLKDANLKQRIARQFTCHLKRLKRIRIYNLQKNPKLLEAFKNYLMRGNLNLDPGDMDFGKLDELIIYYVPMLNALNKDDYDRTCPARINYGFEEEIDASAQGFLGKLLVFVNRMQHTTVTKDSISLFMIPELRGGDAIQMLLRGVLAYHMTGDPQYKDFVLKELIGREHALETADTAGALVLPKWCRKFYGVNITYLPLFGLMRMVKEPWIQKRLQKMIKSEFKDKLMVGLENAVFDFMYYLTENKAIDPDLDNYIKRAVTQVDEFGGNGGTGLDEPRRNYNEDLTENTPAGIEPEQPSQKDIDICEAGINFMGIKMPGTKIDHNEWMAKKAVPMKYRTFEDYIWQRNPFKIKELHSTQGNQQSPGLDLIVPYYLGRLAGKIQDGKDTALVWEDTDKTCTAQGN